MVSFDLASSDFLILAFCVMFFSHLGTDKRVVYSHIGVMVEVEKKEERVLPIDWVATVLLTKEAQEIGIEALKDCSLQKTQMKIYMRWTAKNHVNTLYSIHI